jgi:dTDP-4-amino-4,6-dideoxygalactose transaminase
MDHLADLADEHGVWLVEDAAQAHGAALDGRRVGSLGDVACFSFYPTKNMTTGEGGMVTTDDEEIADRVGRFIDHGRAPGGHVEVGHNFRLPDLAAAIGRVQLSKLPSFNAARRENAHALTDAFEGTDVVPPSEAPGAHHVYHQYTVRSENRDALADHFEAAGIGTGVYYPRAIHEERAYADVTDSFPNAERAAREVLSLPVHPELSVEDRQTIIDTIHNYVKLAT